MSDILLRAKNICWSIGDQCILDEASMVIYARQHTALVGHNGAGKSSLINILKKHIPIDQGEIIYKNNLSMASLAQTMPNESGLTCLEVLKPSEQFSSKQCEHLLHQMQLLPTQLFASLSGGQQRRLLLSKIFTEAPDLLFLDEPTNHLDIQAIHELVATLKRYKGTCFFISHDRWFIEQLAHHILDLEHGQLKRYSGSFEAYLTAKEADTQANLNQQKLRKIKLKQEQRWLERGVTGRRKRNQGRLEKLKQLRHQYQNFKGPREKLNLDSQSQSLSGKKVFDLQDISYKINGKTLFEGFTQTVYRGEKIGIIGGNGVGKTSLVQCMLGTLPLSGGQAILGSQIRLAYLDQQRQQLDDHLSMIENVAGGASHIEWQGQPMHVVGYLQKFLFTAEQAHAPIHRLSGGERNRLLLAKCLAKPSNVLILDEPTNDLDMDSLEMLESYLVAFNGTVILISHDQMFLDHIITSAWLLSGNGKIEVCAGQLDAWQDKVLQSSLTSAPPHPSKNPVSKLNQAQRKRLKQIPNLIEKQEAKLAKLSEPLQDPSFFKRPTAEIKQHQHTISVEEKILEALYDEWHILEATRH